MEGVSFANLVLEGILVAKKDFNAPSHVDLHKIPNLQVIKACQSLTSRGYVKTQFSWQYYYYTLTDSGIGTIPWGQTITAFHLHSSFLLLLIVQAYLLFCRVPP